jgi:REP element-mobilizing transposase RayT
LADSLPADVLQKWHDERAELDRLLADPSRRPSDEERRRHEELHREEIQEYLDAGLGACSLNRSDVAETVAAALKHFEGERYRLLAWCVMPNHVHAVLQPLPDWQLDQIVHSWKSFTAHEANEILGRTGEFWQIEYYDHLIRDDAELEHHVRYTWRNPEEAGLRPWPWRWKAGDYAGNLVEQFGEEKRNGRDARATRNVHAA